MADRTEARNDDAAAREVGGRRPAEERDGPREDHERQIPYAHPDGGEEMTAHERPWTQQIVTQAGSVGATVDDGLYTFKPFRGGDWLSHLDFCSDGSCKVSLAWYAVAKDFHGNVARKGLGRVSYVKFGS